MPRRPNILWLMTDEQRTDSLGAYGSAWARAPRLDALAAGGVLFRSAYTPSPVCVAARASLLTGRACSRIGVLNNHHPLDPSHARFLTHLFSAAGYQVASFGKQHYNCPLQAFEFEGGRVLDEHVGYWDYRDPVDHEALGAVRYPSDDRPWLLAGRFPGPVEQTAEWLNVCDAVDWVGSRDPQRPYFLRVSLNAPHTPVVAPAPFDTQIDPASIELPMDDPAELDLPVPVRENLCEVAGAHRLNRDQVLRTRQCYYGRVAFLDEVLGRLLDRLATLGALENTLIAFCSDHGAHLGDHGFYQKQSFYEASVTVPFFLAGPGIEPGRCVKTPVSLGSLLPTLLDLAQLEVPAPLDFPSLSSAVTGRVRLTDAPVFSEIDFGVWGYREGDRYAMVRHGDWKLSLFRDPRSPERLDGTHGAALCNLREDPGERQNLAGDAAHQAARSRLLAALREFDAHCSA